MKFLTGFKKRLLNGNFCFFFLFLLLVISSCNIFSGRKKDDFELRINNVQLYGDGKGVTFDITIENNTDSTFLLYAFGSCNEVLFDESHYSEGFSYPAGMGMFILDSDSNRLEQFDPVVENVDFEDLNKMKKISDSIYVSSMLKLKPHTSYEVNKKFRFRYYRPEPDEYYIALIYYSGENLVNFVSKEEQRLLEKEEGAVTFQGCVKSNTVRLKIE